MKNFIWILGALLICGFARNENSELTIESQELLERSSVKILSGMCQSAEPTSFGSGPLFEKDGKVYAITSEHVVYHDKNWCFWVQDNEGNRIVSELKAADYAEGMALLEVSAKQTFVGLRSYAKLFDLEPVTKQENVVISGFPYRANESIPDEHGYVHLRKSLLRLIPNVKYLIEIIGSQGEFGMSGSAVYRPKTMGIIGMLSHQYLEIVEEGKPPVVKERTASTKSQGANRLLVIPASDIKRWLKHYFDSGELYQPGIVRDAELQYLRKTVLFSGGLMFTVAPAKGTKIEKRQASADGLSGLYPVLEKGVGVGGEGIGGEGIGGEGIGGEGIGGIPVEGPPITVVIQKDPKGLRRATTWPFAHRSPWIQEKFKQLQEEETKVEIRRFNERIKGPKLGDDRIVTHGFSSLGNFFTLMKYNDIRPSGTGVNIRGPGNEANLQADAERISEKLKKDCEKALSKSESAQLNVLLTKTIVFSTVLHDDWDMLYDFDAKNLQPDEKNLVETWNLFFAKHSTSAGDIYRGLLDAEDLLRKAQP